MLSPSASVLLLQLSYLPTTKCYQHQYYCYCCHIYQQPSAITISISTIATVVISTNNQVLSASVLLLLLSYLPTTKCYHHQHQHYCYSCHIYQQPSAITISISTIATVVIFTNNQVLSPSALLLQLSYLPTTKCYHHQHQHYCYSCHIYQQPSAITISTIATVVISTNNQVLSPSASVLLLLLSYLPTTKCYHHQHYCYSCHIYQQPSAITISTIATVVISTNNQVLSPSPSALLLQLSYQPTTKRYHHQHYCYSCHIYQQPSAITISTIATVVISTNNQALSPSALLLQLSYLPTTKRYHHQHYCYSCHIYQQPSAITISTIATVVIFTNNQGLSPSASALLLQLSYLPTTKCYHHQNYCYSCHIYQQPSAITISISTIATVVIFTNNQELSPSALLLQLSYLPTTKGYHHHHQHYCYISRVSNQNGVSVLYIMLEIQNSGQEPLICHIYQQPSAITISVSTIAIVVISTNNQVLSPSALLLQLSYLPTTKCYHHQHQHYCYCQIYQQPSAISISTIATVVISTNNQVLSPSASALLLLLSNLPTTKCYHHHHQHYCYSCHIYQQPSAITITISTIATVVIFTNNQVLSPSASALLLLLSNLPTTKC